MPNQQDKINQNNEAAQMVQQILTRCMQSPAATGKTFETVMSLRKRVNDAQNKTGIAAASLNARYQELASPVQSSLRIMHVSRR